MSEGHWAGEFDDEDPQWDEPDPDDDSPELLPCPNCGSEIYEDSSQCPICGEYVTFDTTAFSGRAWWWIALGVVGTIATILALIMI